MSDSACASPSKSYYSDSACASPARSIHYDSVDSGSECDNANLATETPGDPDQTIVAGYLKFRDYKKVSNFLWSF
ncbi:unnamed protein product, partial [Nesidiocoris tenuis]